MADALRGLAQHMTDVRDGRVACGHHGMCEHTEAHVIEDMSAPSPLALPGVNSDSPGKVVRWQYFGKPSHGG